MELGENIRKLLLAGYRFCSDDRGKIKRDS